MRPSIYIALTLSLALATGCSKDFLDVEPPSSLTGDTYFRDAADAEASITAAYSSVRNLNTNNYAKISEAPLKEIVIFNTQGLDLDSWSFDANSAIIDDVWQGAYEGIFRANMVLQEVPEIDMEKPHQDRILGEARFLRALFYWQLSTVFGEVPLIIEANPSDASAAALPKSPLEDIHQLMIDDLKKASALLPKRSGYDDNHVGRATKGATQALLGKVYLYKKDYPMAETYLDSVITSGEYTLLPNFSDLLITDNNSESIFEIQYEDILDQGSSRIANDYPQGQGGFANLLPTDVLVEEYEDHAGASAINGKDPRLFHSIFIDGDPYDEVSPTFQSAWTPTGFAKKKGSYPIVRTNNYNLGRNFPVIRLADVMLMYAEALNENNKPTEAVDAINVVRQRVGMPDLPTMDFPTSNKDEIFDAIVHERRIELAFEHSRLNDLQRWGLAESELASEGYSARNRYFPIPQQELDNNPNLTQNPGY